MQHYMLYMYQTVKVTLLSKLVHLFSIAPQRHRLIGALKVSTNKEPCSHSRFYNISLTTPACHHNPKRRNSSQSEFCYHTAKPIRKQVRRRTPNGFTPLQTSCYPRLGLQTTYQSANLLTYTVSRLGGRPRVQHCSPLHKQPPVTLKPNKVLHSQITTTKKRHNLQLFRCIL